MKRKGVRKGEQTGKAKLRGRASKSLTPPPTSHLPQEPVQNYNQNHKKKLCSPNRKHNLTLLAPISTYKFSTWDWTTLYIHLYLAIRNWLREFVQRSKQFSFGDHFISFSWFSLNIFYEYCEEKIHVSHSWDLKGLCHGCLIHFVYNPNHALFCCGTWKITCEWQNHSFMSNKHVS